MPSRVRLRIYRQLLVEIILYNNHCVTIKHPIPGAVAYLQTAIGGDNTLSGNYIIFLGKSTFYRQRKLFPDNYTSKTHFLVTLTHFLVTITHFLVTITHFLVTLTHFLVTLTHFLVTITHFLVTLTHFLVTLTHFLVTLTHFLVTITHFLVTLTHFLVTITHFLVTLTHFLVTLTHFLLTITHSATCRVSSSRGSFLHMLPTDVNHATII